MKICFIISSLSHGGAERVSSLLVNKWSQLGHDVYLITYEKDETEPFYKICNKVTYRKLNLLKDSSNYLSFILLNIRRILALKRAIKNISPDICISFMTETNVLSVISAQFANVPIVVSERIHPLYHEIGNLRKFVRKVVYPLANHLVVQSSDIESWFEKNTSIPSSVIPNPIATDDFRRKESFSESTKIIVSIGRLTKQKGFDILIESFSRLIHDYPDWTLEIYGEGEERDFLTSLIYSLNMDNTVFLKGLTNDTASVLHRAEIFVLTSRYEGYPNVLIEALASGCCTMATNSPGAVSDILNDGEFGMLVGNVSIDAVTRGLNELMSSTNKRSTYRTKAACAINSLDINIIAREWLKIFELIVGKKA